jgi:hypothetical protein
MKPLTIFFGLSLLLLAYNSTSYGQGTPKSQTTAGTENLYKGTEVTLKARVTKKPEPKYTKAARKNQSKAQW